MDKEPKWMLSVIKGVRQRDIPSEEILYEHLHHFSKQILLEHISEEAEALAVFHDSFLIFIGRVRNGNFSLPIASAKQQKRILEKCFQRILLNQVFEINRCAYTLVGGVRRKVGVAVESFATSLNSDALLNHARNLVTRYRIPSVGAEDLLSECIQKVIEIVQADKFKLEAYGDNIVNKKRLYRYFRELMFRRHYKQFMRQEKKLEVPFDEAIAGSFDNLQTAEDPSYDFAQLSVLEQIRALFAKLDEEGREILTAHYFYGKKPQQIAKSSRYETSDSTEKVRKKMAASVEFLGKNLIGALNELQTDQIKCIVNTFREVLENFEEPCRTILLHTLPPRSKSMHEIAEILQQTRPPQEVRRLKTPDQVKKRKLKCRRALSNKIWEQLLTKKI